MGPSPRVRRLKREEPTAIVNRNIKTRWLFFLFLRTILEEINIFILVGYLYMMDADDSWSQSHLFNDWRCWPRPENTFKLMWLSVSRSRDLVVNFVFSSPLSPPIFVDPIVVVIRWNVATIFELITRIQEDLVKHWRWYEEETYSFISRNSLSLRLFILNYFLHNCSCPCREPAWNFSKYDVFHNLSWPRAVVQGLLMIIKIGACPEFSPKRFYFCVQVLVSSLQVSSFDIKINIHQKMVLWMWWVWAAVMFIFKL